MKRAGYGSIFISLALLPIAASGGIRVKPGRTPEVRAFLISEIGYMYRLDSDPRNTTQAGGPRVQAKAQPSGAGSDDSA